MANKIIKMSKCAACGLMAKVAEYEDKTICDSCNDRYLRIPFERAKRKSYDHNYKCPAMWANAVKGVKA